MSDEDMTALDAGNDEFYRQWITVQRPQIMRDLHPSHVVFYMPALNDLLPDLMRSERQSPSEAANLFLDKLLERSDRPGWYREFVDALQSAGYEKLVRLMSFKDVKCDRVFRELISVAMPVLVSIRPMEIMPILLEKGAISDIDMDEIRHVEMSFGLHSAMAELLCRLPKHREDWFHAFVIALRETNHKGQLKSLEPMLTTANSDESIERILDDLQLGNSEEFTSDSKKLNKLQSKDPSLAEDGEGGSVRTEELQYEESREPSFEVNAPNVELNNLNLDVPEEKHYCKDPKFLSIAVATGQASTAPTKPVAKATRILQLDNATSSTGQNQETTMKQIGHNNDQGRNISYSMRSTSNQSGSNDAATEFVYVRNNFTDDREDQYYSSSNNFLSLSLRTEGPPTGSYDQGLLEANPGGQRGDESCNESLVSFYSATSTPGPEEEEERQLVPNTILISNFPIGVDMDTIVEHFGMVGDIQLNSQRKPKIRLLRDKTTKEYKGQAVITYSNDTYANTAVDIFNETDFEDKFIKVAIARRKIRQCASASSSERTIVPDLDLLDGGSTLRPSEEDSAGSPSGVDENHEELKLRGYQEELAAKAKMGHNCVIVAPTGSGKTHVAMEIIRNHVVQMKRRIKKPTIVFFVPTVALVEQQRKQFVRYLRNCKILGLSGDQDAKLPLSELLPINDIIVLTPQILENALKQKDIGTVSELTLIIFDECHHTNKGHPYNMIMSHYIDEKLKPASSSRRKLPQVVGLTASVGVGKSKTKEQAVQCILKLCANLDATEICTVKNSVEELTRHVNRPGEDTKEISGRREDPFFNSINIIMSKIEAKMKNSDFSKLVLLENGEFNQVLQAPAERGGDRYTQWISRLQKSVDAIQDQLARRFYVSCLHAVQIYNTALLINADCRTKDALDYIVKELNPEKVNDLHDYQDGTDGWLKQLFEDKKASLEELSKDPKYENPKLNCLKNIICGEYTKAPDSRVIVFCKTREMTVALVNWMKDTKELRSFNPHGLVGTNAPSDKAGMTQVKQVDVLEKFKTGDHKLIVATSVAEEGLDVQKCNIVIRYEHVTNQIARVQSRGRARADNAQYMVVAEKGRGAAEKEESNKIREKMMQKAIDVINDYDAKRKIKEIDKYQREAQVERVMANKGKEINKLLKSSKTAPEPVYELRCRKCNSFSTFSTNIRKIEASHHVILDPEYDDRIKIRPHPAPKCFEKFELTGKIFCKRCHLQWGIKAVYKKVSFPVVKVGSLIVLKDGREQKVYRRWKEVPFTVKMLSPDDLQAMMEHHQNENHQIEVIGDDEETLSQSSDDDDSMYSG